MLKGKIKSYETVRAEEIDEILDFALIKALKHESYLSKSRTGKGHFYE